MPALWRTLALERDQALHGPGWPDALALQPAAARYRRRLVELETGQPDLLLAHAYVRYLGDLSGGQILQRLLAKSLALTPQQLSFYDFPRFDDLAALKSVLVIGMP